MSSLFCDKYSSNIDQISQRHDRSSYPAHSSDAFIAVQFVLKTSCCVLCNSTPVISDILFESIKVSSFRLLIIIAPRVVVTRSLFASKTKK